MILPNLSLNGFFPVWVYFSVIQNENQSRIEWIKKSLFDFFHHFEIHFISSWRSNTTENLINRDYVKNIFRDSIGFAGCEILRRILNVVRLPYLKYIQDPEKNHQIESTMIAAGRYMTRNYYKLNGIEECINCISKITSESASEDELLKNTHLAP